MKESKKIIFTLLTIVFLIGLALAVFAQSSPQLPHGFWGNANVEGAPLPAGSVIIAKVGGIEKGRYTTVEDGKYGGITVPSLVVQDEDGITEDATIELFVSTVKANEVAQFKSGTKENKNLTWTFPSTIDFGEGLPNEPYTCMPGTDIEISLDGLTISIECDTAEAGTINNISILDTPTSGAIAVFPASNISTFYEISILGDVDIIATITYDDTGIDESIVRPYKFVGGVWTAVPDADIISRDTAGNKITFKIPAGGTPYAVFGSAPTPSPTSAPSGDGGAGGGGGGGGGGGCTYNWLCTEWSACSENGKQTRTCTNEGTCLGTLGKPAETQDCVYTAGVVEEGAVEGEELPVEGEEEATAEPTAPTGGLLGITGRAIQNLLGRNVIVGFFIVLFIVMLGLVFYYAVFKKR